jgi:hypothetical protein
MLARASRSRLNTPATRVASPAALERSSERQAAAGEQYATDHAVSILQDMAFVKGKGARYLKEYGIAPVMSGYRHNPERWRWHRSFGGIAVLQSRLVTVGDQEGVISPNAISGQSRHGRLLARVHLANSPTRSLSTAGVARRMGGTSLATALTRRPG